MRAVDFFCGAGGFTAGIRRAGIDVLGGVDADETCRLTYTMNNPGTKFICADLRELSVDDLTSEFPDLQVDDDDLLFVGCAPCQPFSQQRRVERPHPDGALLSSFGRLVEAFRPGCVIVENVPGIAAVRGNSTYNRFRCMLRRHGYSVKSAVLDAKAYGVPQSRRRLVLIASRIVDVTLPVATHGPELIPWVTVRDAIGHFPALRAGDSAVGLPNHRASALSPLNAERMRHTPKDGGSRNAWPGRLVLECHKDEHRGHSDVYGRMRWDNPAPTLTGRCHSISNGRFGHPEQDRALSLREAAALQTFPDDYEFFGVMRKIALNIGNAVPVELAAILGRHVTALASTAGGAAGVGQRAARGGDVIPVVPGGSQSVIAEMGSKERSLGWARPGL